MTRSLPPKPSLEQLKKQAKDLLKSFRAGDSSVCEILRYHYRFARATDENMLQAEVTLQEIQHALALDYGFKSWKDLSDHVKSSQAEVSVLPDDVHWFFEQCAEGLNQGLPLVYIFRGAMDKAENPNTKDLIKDIGGQVECGTPFSDALAKHSRVFNDACIAMVRTGEVLGTLDQLVKQIVAQNVARPSSPVGEDAMEVVKYVNLVLFTMHQAGTKSLVLKQSQELPEIQGANTTFQYAVNRLKVMADVDPVSHAEPVNGRVHLKIGGEPIDLKIAFYDQVDDPCCEIVMGTAGDQLVDTPEERTARIVGDLFEGAFKGGASDIHFEWVDGRLVVRYRIDGRLQEVGVSIPSDRQQAVIDRIKVMCAMDVEQRDRPQNGRALMEFGGRQIDFRVSIMPYVGGESAVVRIMDRANTMMPLERQGLTDSNIAKLRDWKDRPNGMFFITGPTGSGKTTTMYSVLREIDPGQRKIITCEEPVEYIIEGINQQNVDPEKGLPLLRVVREVMRQDPDVIMLGEIRDEDSLSAAIQIALTGHLVFSAMHTTNAADGIRRLMSVAPESYRLNSCLIGIMAQRLIRVICKECREEYEPEPWAIEVFGDMEDVHCFRGTGCDACKGHGYRGRIAVQELLEIDDALRGIISKDGTVEDIHAQAVKSGMITMKQDGLAKVVQGITTIDEVLRVCG